MEIVQAEQKPIQYIASPCPFLLHVAKEGILADFPLLWQGVMKTLAISFLPLRTILGKLGQG